MEKHIKVSLLSNKFFYPYKHSRQLKQYAFWVLKLKIIAIITMKTTKGLIFIIAIIAIVSCKKDTKTTTTTSAAVSDNYSSIKDFLSKNGVAMQTYTISGSTGGSFTSPQGTTVTIPANAFLTQAGIPVPGNVTIQFKDIYKKSDMLLSNMPTMTTAGNPLKSGGEFFIKVIFNNSAVILAAGKKITVKQPASLTGGLDTINIQQPFVAQQDSAAMYSWGYAAMDSTSHAIGNYVFSLYHGSIVPDSGSWCNSDNSTYFSAYTEASLTLVPNDNVLNYGTYVFLIFKNISSMIHIYFDWGMNKFPYSYAPQGLQCTMVAVGVKNGTLYSSFVPITIGANQTYSFTLGATTTSTFKTQLLTLN